ncbi:MAG TPA: Zn-dependent hydrolase [Flavobacteriales bacterium]
MSFHHLAAPAAALLLMTACTDRPNAHGDRLGVDSAAFDERVRPEIYARVKLTTDLGALSANEKAMLPLLLQAAAIMDSLFWEEAWGRKDSLPAQPMDEDSKRFFRYNYGPWDRLAGDLPFVPDQAEKPKGARFYPADMTLEEFEGWVDPRKSDAYSMVRRDSTGKLMVVPYHVWAEGPVQRAADLLRSAAALADAPGLRKYLLARAEALLTDRYDASDSAWLDMRDNTIDVIIGPIENYEDQLLGIRTAHACYIAVKDKEWTVKLDRFAKLLPALQRALPTEERFKRERPGGSSQLGAYDVVYYAGDCNAGGKTIAVNLPNDEALQLRKGTRRLQFKNAMRAKFDRILAPIGNRLIAADQRRHITFDAFFEDVMFHEVAHGLGIKNTVNGKGTVREALLEEHGALEEGKADILGLWMIGELRNRGEITTGSMLDNQVTFLAGILRSVRFGASSAHGRANMFRFNYLFDRGAFLRDDATGTYRVDPEAMDRAMDELCALILRLQGEGAIDELRKLMAEQGTIRPELQADLDRLAQEAIPVDIVFEQGMEALGLRRTP